MANAPPINHRVASLAGLLLCLTVSSACGSNDREGAAQTVTVATASATAGDPAADSAFAPAVLVARFREQSPEHPSRFGGGAARNLDSLLARYVRGVERTDTTSLAALALTRGEFAWLYYLDSPMAQKPYELDPDAMWQQLQARSARGRERALAAYGHQSLGAWESECAPPRASGGLRLHDCAIILGAPAGAPPRRLRLSVVERDRLFKLTSLATSL